MTLHLQSVTVAIYSISFPNYTKNSTNAGGFWKINSFQWVVLGPQGSNRCSLKQSRHDVKINQSQACSTLCQIALSTCTSAEQPFEGIMQLLDAKPQHIFGKTSVSTPGLIVYLTGWCKVHLQLILQLLKLWSIQVYFKPEFCVLMC